MVAERITTMEKHSRSIVWIDLENSPHVPFFIPIILQLEQAGCTTFITARDFVQTRELIEQAGLNARFVGGEYGSATLWKALGLTTRALRLAWIAKGRNINLAIGHGSRGLLLAARMLRIPTLTLYDYEGASVSLFNKWSTYVMTPEAIPPATLYTLGLSAERHLTYPGLKEDMYVCDFTSNDSILSELNIDPSKILVTIRPPSRTAHYRSEASFRLFEEMMRMLKTKNNVQVVITPRDKSQKEELQQRFSNETNIIIPPHAVNGLNLLYHSDLVISGGGTMNREAAALGVPCITIFKGQIGAVDRDLIDKRKMIEVTKAEEVLPYLFKRTAALHPASTKTRETIVNTILRLASQ